jgi:putative ABC transport system permease protein
MRLNDVVGEAVAALFRQKVRSVLTTFGVVVGAFVLTMSGSVGRGVKEAVLSQFRRHDQMRKIVVWAAARAGDNTIPPEELKVPGEMSEARRERLREAIARRWVSIPSVKTDHLLTPARVRQLEGLDHVRAVVPNLTRVARAYFDGKDQVAMTVGVEDDSLSWRKRLIAGNFLPEGGGKQVLVGEYLLYRWGMEKEADVAKAIGKKVRIDFRNNRPHPGQLLSLLNAGWGELTHEEELVLAKAIAALPAALRGAGLSAKEKEILTRLLKNAKPPSPVEVTEPVSETVTIAGVVRDPTKEERQGAWEARHGNFDLILPVELAKDLFSRSPGNKNVPYGQVTVLVDDEANLKQVQGEIAAMGLENFSLVSVVDEVRFVVYLITFLTGFLALVALVVSALGITNTMLMSVLERIREIGVMKAVGAKDRDVLRMFLVEGALIGLVGGAIGVFLSWLASFPGDHYARQITQKHTQVRIEESLFMFPWWLVVGVPLFVALVTMLAAWYPARRAARVNPISALRHE